MDGVIKSIGVSDIIKEYPLSFHLSGSLQVLTLLPPFVTKFVDWKFNTFVIDKSIIGPMPHSRELEILLINDSIMQTRRDASE